MRARQHVAAFLPLGFAAAAALTGLVVAAAVLFAVSGTSHAAEAAGVVVLLPLGFGFARLARQAQTVAAVAVMSLFAVLFLVPVDYLPLGRTALSARIDPILLCALLGLAGPRAAESGRRAWPFFLAAAVALLGAVTFFAYPGSDQRYYFLSFILVGCLVFVMAWRGSRTQAALESLSRVVMWSGGIASAFAIVEYVLKRNPLFGGFFPPGSATTGPFYFGFNTYRVTTTIGHPLVGGALLGVALIVSVGLGLETTSRRERGAALAIASLAFVAVIMTKSRSDLVLVPVALLVLIGLSSRSNRIRAVQQRVSNVRVSPIVLIALVVFGLWATRDVWTERLSGTVASQSTEARVVGLHYAEAVLPSALPFGLGFGASQAREGAQGNTIGGASAEDGWLELLVDAGPLFVLALAAIPAAAGFAAVRASKGDPLRLCHGIATLFMMVNAASFAGIAVPPRSFLFVMLAEAGVAIPAVVVRSHS